MGALTAFALAFALFVGMLLLHEAGRRIGLRHLRRDPEAEPAGVGAVDGAVFGLLGLMVAFTFSGAAERFDTRRALIVEETNDIGTAYLRIDLMPADAQAAMRDSFRRYLDSRITTYRHVPIDLAAAHAELANTVRLQTEIWSQAIAACRAQGALPTLATVLLPALNAMFDITTTRTLASQVHPPAIIFIMLFTLALASAVIAGYGTASTHERSWLRILAFAAVMAIAVYVVLDLEYPRLGLIRVDAFDEALITLRAGMN